ncbi:MAG TPA: hypothetical protein VFS00_15845 [Polyangiaceae bacterium]|nr:hypothetical protein [Polyangiaceae bacterium]
MAAPLTAQVTVVYEAAAPHDCPGAEALASRANAVLGRRALAPGPDRPEPRAPGAGPAPTRLEVRLGLDGPRRTARVVASGALWGSREIVDGAAGRSGQGDAGRPNAEGETGRPGQGEAGRSNAEGETGRPGQGEAGRPAEGEAGQPGGGEAGRPNAEGEGGGGCESLAEAVVTALALMVESGAGGERRGGAVEGAPDPWRIEASVGALGALGLLKGPRPVGWAGAYLGVTRRVGASLGVGYVVPASFSSGGVEVDLGLFFGQAEACLDAWTAPALSLRACAGGALGSLSASAEGVENGSPRRRPWLAAGGGLVAAGPSRAGFGWWGRLGGWAPLRRQGFRVEGVGTVFEPSPAAIGLGGGLRWSNW